MLLAPKLMGSFNYACFASKFNKVERTLDEYDPKVFDLHRTDEKLLVAQPWSMRPFDRT